MAEVAKKSTAKKAAAKSTSAPVRETKRIIPASKYVGNKFKRV